MSWFDDNGPGKGTSPNTTSYGSQNNQLHTAADIAALWRQYTGRDPTPQESGQWGQNNIDDAYFEKIRQAIQASQPAQDYAKSQAALPEQGTTTPTTPTSTTGEDWRSKDYSDWNTVKAYAQSRGVQLSDETAQ